MCAIASAQKPVFFYPEEYKIEAIKKGPESIHSLAPHIEVARSDTTGWFG